MKKSLVLALGYIVLNIAMPAQAAGDAAAGQAKSATCTACHGTDGNSVSAEFPKLAGQSAKYIVKQLMDYKEGKTRNNPVMTGMVAPLNPQDMEDLAAYYSKQTVKVGVADEATLALGQNVYRGGITATGVAACMACHGPGGRGNPVAGYPAVSGQHAQYTADQLMKFRKAERANDAGRMMRNVAKRMTDEEITAVSQYMMGLH